MVKILIAEDDLELKNLYIEVLSGVGYEVIEATNGKEALLELEKNRIDLVISDVMMPEIDGLELTESIRLSNKTIPILMISAKDTFRDKEAGFMVGTDDYMVKPVDINEMLLRVKALLRRAQILTDQQLTIGETLLVLDELKVTWENHKLILPQKEFLLLYKLASSPNKIFTRQQLMDDIWGLNSETDPRTVDVHINRLRDKLADNPELAIKTIRGLGYKLGERDA